MWRHILLNRLIDGIEERGSGETATQVDVVIGVSRIRVMAMGWFPAFQTVVREVNVYSLSRIFEQRENFARLTAIQKQ
jgi:hypothetical protein